jgi:hypothetical protein
MRFFTNGTERVRITSAGSVGIGTSSPSYQLDVQGTTTTAQIRSTSTTAGNYPKLIFNHAGNDGFTVGGGDGLRFLASTTTEVMRITSAGNVGIGTSSPSARLHVAGGADSTIRNTASSGSSWFVGSNASGYILHNESNTSMLFTTNGTERMRIDSAGNVGIGTSSPSNRLSVVTASGSDGFISVASPTTETAGVSVNGGTSTNKGAIVRFQKDASTKWTMGTDSAIIGGTSDNFHLYSGGANAILFSTNAAERMRIDSGGNLLYGQTANFNCGDTNTTTGIGFEGAGIGTIYASRASSYSGSFNRNSDGTLVRFGRSGSTVGSISVTTTLTSYNVSSDRRLKENIVPLTTGLASVLALKPSQYNYKADPTTSIQGFIADELQQIVPHAVTGETNAVDKDGKPIYQGVDASFLIPFLVSAIQELNAKITALENK